MRDDLFLRVLFKGLFRELISNERINSGLKIFLPYSVTYPDKDISQPVVKLIPPKEIEIYLQDNTVADNFFSNAKNKVVVGKAITVGRKNCALWKLIIEINSHAKREKAVARPRFFILPDASGDRTYSQIASSLSSAAENKGDDEYDVSEFGSLYPTLAIIMQEDYHVIGAVSIDCSINLKIIIDRIFNEFAQDYMFLNAWEFDRYSLMEFYRNAPTRLTSKSENPFYDISAHDHKAAEWTGLYEKVKSLLENQLETESFKRIIEACSYLNDENKHFILKCLFGDNRTCELLWVLLAEGTEHPIVNYAKKVSSNKCLRFITGVSQATITAFNIGVACLLQENVFNDSSIEMSPQMGYTDLQISSQKVWHSLSRNLTQKVEAAAQKIAGENLVLSRPHNLNTCIALLCEVVKKAWSEASKDHHKFRPIDDKFGYLVLPIGFPHVGLEGNYPVSLFVYDNDPASGEHMVDLTISVHFPAALEKRSS